MTPAFSQRLHSLDYLRILAIMYFVGFWHLMEYTGLPRDVYNTELTRRLATVALSIFVLISGYRCAQNPVDRLKDLPAWYGRHLLRIYPPFLVACLLFWLMDIDGPARLLQGASLVGIFTDQAPRTLWFVAMLVLFYVLAPIFLFLRRQVWASIGVLLAILLVAAVYGAVTGLLDQRFILFLPCFVTGILMERHQPQPDWRTAVFVVALWLIAASLTLLIPFEALRDSPLLIPLSVVSSVGLFLLAQKYAGGLRPPAFIVAISQASFFLYLFHRPLYQAVKPIFAGQSVPVHIAGYVGVALPLLILGCVWAHTQYQNLIRPLKKER